MSIKKFVLIVAGGSGSRMNSTVPKQFIPINGKPLLIYTFESFLKFDSNLEFILVLPEKEINNWKKLCHQFSFQVNHQVVAGGKTRFHSVRLGLEVIHEEGIVFIHDGVRPLVSEATLKSCLLKTLETGNAIPVISPSESIRKVTKNKNKPVDRNRYFLVQTPQTFKVSLIKEAYQQEYSTHFTDDASVLENKGYPVHLVEGNRENIKVTWPEDLAFAHVYLQNK